MRSTGVGASGAGVVLAGALLALAGVAAGAFGAHALRGRLPADSLVVYHTAVHYHLYHALAMVVAGLAQRAWPAARWPLVAGSAFGAGVVLFSGSLYLLALGGMGGIGVLTPLGGLAFMAGWLVMAGGAWRARSASH